MHKLKNPTLVFVKLLVVFCSNLSPPSKTLVGEEISETHGDSSGNVTRGWVISQSSASTTFSKELVSLLRFDILFISFRLFLNSSRSDFMFEAFRSVDEVTWWTLDELDVADDTCVIRLVVELVLLFACNCF